MKKTVFLLSMIVIVLLGCNQTTAPQKTELEKVRDEFETHQSILDETALNQIPFGGIYINNTLTWDSTQIECPDLVSIKTNANNPSEYKIIILIEQSSAYFLDSKILVDGVNTTPDEINGLQLWDMKKIDDNYVIKLFCPRPYYSPEYWVQTVDFIEFEILGWYADPPSGPPS